MTFLEYNWRVVTPDKLSVGDSVMQPTGIEREIELIIPQLVTFNPSERGYLVMYKGVGESRFIAEKDFVDARFTKLKPEWE